MSSLRGDIKRGGARKGRWREEGRKIKDGRVAERWD
jgi:hypothetical protein